MDLSVEKTGEYNCHYWLKKLLGIHLQHGVPEDCSMEVEKEGVGRPQCATNTTIFEHNDIRHKQIKKVKQHKDNFARDSLVLFYKRLLIFVN